MTAKNLQVITLSISVLLMASAYRWTRAEKNATAEQEVRKVEEQRRQAILSNDIKTLDSLMAPEYTAIFQLFAGKVLTKTEELALNQSDNRRVQSWDPSEVSIRIYRDVGLVTGLADVVDVLKGDRRHIRFRYTHVWAKQNGTWLLVHRHTTRVATFEGPKPA